MAKFKEGQTIEIIIEGFFKTYTTPPVPSLKTIVGHDLPKKEQKWNRPHIPSDEEAKDMTKSEKSTIIEREMNRRISGYWFMNNGVPTYITGDHYFCLTYWFMGALTKDGYPEYRAAAAKWYYVMDMAEKSENCYGLIMSTNKRFGKCIDIQTLIPTPSGWKKMIDITVGDTVFGADGKPALVTFDSGIKFDRPCYNITFSDGSSIVSDDEHRWLASSAKDRRCDKRYGPQYQRTQVVTTKDMLQSLTFDGKHSNWSIDNCKPVEYEKKKLPIPPYIFGLWLGDGASAGPRLTTTDIELEEAWFEYGKSIGLIPKNRGIQKYLSSDRRKNIFVTTIKEMGVINNKHIPEIYLQSSIEDRIALLQGLMDTDGTSASSKKRNAFSFCNYNKKLALGIKELLESLGIKVNFFTYKDKKDKDDLVYFVNFLTYDFLPFRLERKIKNINRLEIKNSPSSKRFIRSIEPVESRPVKCIQVDNESHTFLCGPNYIVTHNTEYALSSLYNAATLVDEECLYGMQSLNATEAKNNLFKSRLMRSHKRIPNWIKPVSNESKGTKEIVSELTFMGEKMDGGGYKAGLNNIIDWRPTIPSAYQGKRPRKIFLDEPGSLEEMSLIEWWTTVREQLALGKRIFGKASLPTTMEDMKKKGAIEFVKLWEDSNPEDLDKNGRTKSGLWRYFKPFFLGREGFVDEYGNDLIEEAKQFRQNQLEHADHAAAEKIKRQYPETVEEAFGVVMSGKWEADVKDILKTALAEAEAKDITRYFKISKYDNTIRLQPCKSTDPEAVMIVEDPEPGVKYGGGIDSIGTDNQTGDEGGSKLAFCITKGFGGMGLSYAPICLYEFRPDRLEDAYRVISYITEYYGATAGPKMFKVMGETNAGATNLLNFLINAGLKSHMAKKPGSLGLTNGKEKTSADKYWLYRTDDVKDYQYLLANRFVRKYGHNIKIPRLLKSLLDLGVVNADAADAFLTSLMLFQDFDEVKKQEQKSTGRWISKWNDDAKQWDWSYIEN